ncbi:hypothetical protein LCGC14_0244210 [marine sediment metagenome]|uniref:Uncharacterized protein n=1 Tax=marine sediment metagenome TaxID=412755 RepID=A0A0F9UB17_9ZZZZ
MRIRFTLNGKGIGYLDYEIVNWNDKLGQMGSIITGPHQLGFAIEQKIRTNAYHVVVSGGDMPPDLSMYWDGVVATLNKVKQEIRGFDYIVPAGQDPLKDTTSVSTATMKGRIH